ncbi:DUF2325 domain-containing protein [Ottowia testudinis]|uniref:DUF2325 domain-containing protein n=1 Tax=Ottowia testudinis TaxID=2816950 RepID=A0A975CFX2_9BURK|nr:DUF2325 domain-containing protein [Ottowia testudinis]QTD44351.1 DUF2325 domain-containing protein [Ottowia testudinis]
MPFKEITTVCKKCETVPVLAAVSKPPQTQSITPQLVQTLMPAVPIAELGVRKRKKIWTLSSRWHCPLVGTCLPLGEMRKIAMREGYQTRGASDYDVHGLVVTQCHTRTPIAELVQRYLDKHYAAALMRFTRIRGEDQALALWREEVASGQDITGALWAAWTHPDIDAKAGEIIFGDIHMLSHQVGSQARADLRLQERLKHDNAELLKRNRQLQQEIDKARLLKSNAVAQLERDLDAARSQLAHYSQREAQFDLAQRLRHEHAALRERAETLDLRVNTLTERNTELQRQYAEAQVQQAELHEELLGAESALALLLDDAPQAPCAQDCPVPPRLSGRCVLCIGGRQNLVQGYRRLVEAHEGRFMHHDGGQEESLHRIDAIVSGVDAVVCQSGCVSHGAYWKIKDACKKLGKPCVFVASPGIASFARSLETLTAQAVGSA